jgi:hypothetical protein
LAAILNELYPLRGAVRVGTAEAIFGVDAATKSRLGPGKSRSTGYFAFDVLNVEGADVHAMPLKDRRAILYARQRRRRRRAATMSERYPTNHDALEWPGESNVTDGLNGAPGILNFRIQKDPGQPRVRALQVETTVGTFTVAFDPRIAVALATTLISEALAIDPSLKENFIGHANKSPA